MLEKSQGFEKVENKKTAGWIIFHWCSLKGTDRLADQSFSIKSEK